MGRSRGTKKESVPETEPLHPGSLRKHSWQRFLRGPDAELLEKLYVPALSEATRYDRCCSYFSSTVLSVAARGFAGLIRRLEGMGRKRPVPAVRLLVNEELSEEDVEAICDKGDVSALEKKLKKQFKSPKDALERDRLAMLAWLVQKGWLAVRVGVMRRGGGILHAKYGIVTDGKDDAIVFRGSGNESAQGLISNFENLEVSTSWEDRDALRRYREEFERLWANEDPHVLTVSLPEAIRLRLIKYASKEAPVVEPAVSLERAKAAMVWQFITASPYMPNGAPVCDATAMVDLWPHQRRVVEETANAWPTGRLLCDEVGMGKTIESILVLRRLICGRGVKRLLILLPAGLLKQWQGELREKGGLLFPRLEGTSLLVWPDGRSEKTDLASALRRDALLMSRETARTENNLAVLMAAPPWDLVLLDEAHAARRKKQEEGEFNTGNLLLTMLRELQLRGRARSILLLSATPMQTHPWEPSDLIGTLGEGGVWLSEFAPVREFYEGIGRIEQGGCTESEARRIAALIKADGSFPELPDVGAVRERGDFVRQLTFSSPERRKRLANWLRGNGPLGRRMHRNTRDTLRQYHRLGLIEQPPPDRKIHDAAFGYKDSDERRVYESIKGYIERRFAELEGEKKGKGFVMTVYRRRAASSPRALEESLKRRRAGLLRVINQKAVEWWLSPEDEEDRRDVDELEGSEDLPPISPALPSDPETAKRELEEVEDLLERIRALGNRDTKRDRFWDELRKLTEDGRSVLVFTQYTDTMRYIRDQLVSAYGTRLGCYSGDGGEHWDGESWKVIGKDAITEKLNSADIQVLICTDAASEGLNLQAAGALINYDLPWNPSRVEQRIGRIDRIGQKNETVYITNLILKGSVDERVYGALRRRCGLFERFVGRMQPVLSRARRLLLFGATDEEVEDLEATAAQVDADVLGSELYHESEAVEPPREKPPLGRQDIDRAMEMLSADMPISAKRRGLCWSVRKRGAKSRVASTSEIALAADDRAVPVTPESEVASWIAAGLDAPGTLSPLVIGSYESGAYRVSIPVWVGHPGAGPVTSLSQLQKLLSSWSGEVPEPAAMLDARSKAEKKARGLVRDLERRTRFAEQAGIGAQLEAARHRLVRELGRYLVCLDQGTSDLNGFFHREMTQHSATAERLREAYEKLGGYPKEFSDAEFYADLIDFVEGLTANQRKARLALSEIDAALRDPRWLAGRGL